LEEDPKSRRERRESVKKFFLLQLLQKPSEAWQTTKGFFRIHPDFCHNRCAAGEDRFITALQIGLAKLELRDVC